MKTFMTENYQKEKPFAGFLPGIAGKEGLPMWVYYVNRGQAISTFGVRDKNGAITEFYPANLAYAYIHQNGFRTFIKYQNETFECFQEQHDQQKMMVDAHEISLEQTITKWAIKIKVTYATLPNMPLSALMRKVELVNLDGKEKPIVIVDGLAHMLPAGIDYGGYKAVSYLLQSWMEVQENPDHVFLKLRASTADSSEVKAVDDGNFYTYVGLENARYIYDYKAIFAQDSSFTTPYRLQSLDYQSFILQPQAPVNQVPAAFVAASLTLKTTQTFFGVFGYSQSRAQLSPLIAKMTPAFLLQKFTENHHTIRDLIQEIKTESSSPMFDAYLQQCYLDNILRGGYPIQFDTLDGSIGYHLYSRKHGDLERDYNFFSLEPSYLSQGNGAFRDVLQNRRNDIYFHPEVGTTTIAQFASLIQADGYNPLSIEGITFTFAGDLKAIPEPLHDLLKGEFTPGQIANRAGQLQLPIMPTVIQIIKQSHYHFKATYGEGYWGDHFTYFLDLIETYLDIYPDQVNTLLSQKHRYFVSPARVLKREEKYVLNHGKVRQYHAVHHDHGAPQRGWLKLEDGQDATTSLLAKLITLITNKFSQLDPEGLGLMYEGERPGWNDAMNGIPGLFGSGVSEMLELKRLVAFMLKQTLVDTKVLSPLMPLIQALLDIQDQDLFTQWSKRMSALETYRDQLLKPLTLVDLPAKTMHTLLVKMQQTLDESLQRLLKIHPIPYTYFTYEVTDYELLPKVKAQDPQRVRAKAFKRKPLPHFLEAPARLLSNGFLTPEQAHQLFEQVKQSPLYDPKLNIYKTSTPLEQESMEIGRIRAFTPGWLERESAFLHMTYKYMLGLLKAKTYQDFNATMQTGLTCFMDPKVYGRSPLENSSFIATSNNPDASKHGQGFYARLSGSTAEVLSMWKYLYLGKQLFSLQQGQLTFKIAPVIPATFFQQNVLETTLFASIKIKLILQDDLINAQGYTVTGYRLFSSTQTQPIAINGPLIQGDLASAIRQKQFQTIEVLLKGGHTKHA
jgi:hypothetical protein